MALNPISSPLYEGGDPHWREDLYFSFADEQHQLGGYVWASIRPDQPEAAEMLVSFYHGNITRRDAGDIAAGHPRHLYRAPGGAWVYCYKGNVSGMRGTNLDAMDLDGLRIRRTTEHDYQLAFNDREGTAFALALDVLTTRREPEPAPGNGSWLPDGYQQSWKVRGNLTIAGRRFDVDTTGHGLHAWGALDEELLRRSIMRSWSFQSPDGELAVAVSELEPPDAAPIVTGYIDMEGVISPVTSVRHVTRYAPNGLQDDVSIEVHDEDGRLIRATLTDRFGCVGGVWREGLWGFEAAGAYNVRGFGMCTGIASYWWPPSISANDVHTGRVAVPA